MIPSFQNMEQIQYLEWLGEYNQVRNTFGKRIPIWDRVTMPQAGGYQKNGKKQGLWKQPIQNYWNEAQNFEIGEYIDDEQDGRWNYINQELDLIIIGDGLYCKGIKIGKWIELNDGYYEDEQVIYSGEYKNGKKVAVWNIEHDELMQKKIKGNSGGGFYNEGIKIGKWVELDEGSYYDKITSSSEYKNGKKFGKLQNVAGNVGGFYQDGINVGRLIKFDDEYYPERKVSYGGQYKNGKKKLIEQNTILVGHLERSRIDQGEESEIQRQRRLSKTRLSQDARRRKLNQLLKKQDIE